MIFDYNEKKAKELFKKDPDRYASKIAELRAKPLWFIRYWRNGVPLDERVPDDYQKDRDEAERYYKIITGKIEDGKHSERPVRQATIAEMCAFFILQKEKRIKRGEKVGGAAAAKTACRQISKAVGHLTFWQCREDPELLSDYIYQLPELHPEWSQKTMWNHFKELHAVFATWIKKKLIETKNPMDAIDTPEQGTAVIEYVPTHEDYERIITTGLIEGVNPEVLRLIGACRYTGFRVNEVLHWQVEDVVLSPDDGLPYVWVEISKQRRKARVPRPIHAALANILRQQVRGRETGLLWSWKNPPYKLLKIYHTNEKGEKVLQGSLYEVAGVEVPRPFHDFRKLVKLELKRKIDPKRAQAYQGHKSESMDDWYTWWQREDLEAAFADSYRGHNGGPK